MMVCRSWIVLCIPLVLKVTAFMGGWRYSFIFMVLGSFFLCVGLIDACVGLRLDVSCALCHILYCSSVVCLYLVVSMGGLRWGITLGAGKAQFMRGGACAAELCLMVVCVCVHSYPSCCLSGCGCCGCMSFSSEFVVYGLWMVSICMFSGVGV